VSRRSAEKEEGTFHDEGRSPDREQRRPQQRRIAPRPKRPFSERMLRRAGLSQTGSPHCERLHAREPKTAHSLHLMHI
jgi:hypothetical protein